MYHRFVKPFVPRRLQIAIRSKIALLKRPYFKNVWPIEPESAKAPHGWAGWPEGKKFALVITHDVDTAAGQKKCHPLIDLEKRLGFRSSFNFVPEGYQVDANLRHFLTDSGFEVGVHGLVHDGSLFKSRNIFLDRAPKINRYIRDWGAVGFRSPSMYYNLEWIHDLNISYDTSTFDTDPFEPQPHGVGTIFPFWVGRHAGAGGYVELPYTLPQDFTLFALLREQNINTWKTKLDWIADNGGMALLNVHPDYMSFDKEDLSFQEYPASLYEDFLEYIKAKHEDQYWHALPKDMARFWSTHYSNTAQKVEKIRACMIAYTFYESDGRVRRYAEALAARGDCVDVIALRREGQPAYEILNGVHVFRIQKRQINEKGKLDYLYRLAKFFIYSSIFLAKRNRGTRYDLIHVHSVPDFEVFAAWLPKLSGAKIILDIHDILPEFYASKFDADRQSIIFKTLVRVEKASAKFADHVIAANHIWEKTLTDRSVNKEKCTTFLNYPDTSIFRSISPRKADGRFIALYPGTLNKHQGLDIAIKAFSIIKDDAPEAEFHIYGDGPDKPMLQEMVARLGLDERILFKDIIPIEEIAQVMANADLGIVPKRNDFFGGEAFSTKILEFMILGVPVVVSATKIDKYYFNDSLVKFFKPDDEHDLAQAMLALIKNKALRDQLVKNALNFVSDYTWDKKKDEYFNLVDSLIGNIHSS